MRSKFTYAAIIALVLAVLVPYTAAAADNTLSAEVQGARVAAERGLISLGINPGDAVFQVGSRNYAGPDCPGSGWNCTTASVVVQIGSAAMSANEFTCQPANDDTAPNCEVIQLTPAKAGATNSARCVEQTSSDNPAFQRCVIMQTNASGTNRAFVDQRIMQSQGRADTCGALQCQRQDARQVAKISQMNDSGKNESQVAQTIDQKQAASVGLTGTPFQKQEAHQKTKVCQGGLVDPCTLSTTGKNKSEIAQTNLQNLKVGFANGSVAIITQEQNTDPLGPKSIAVVRQNSVADNNDSRLVDLNRQTATVRKAGEEDKDDEGDRDDNEDASTLGSFNGTVVQRQGIPFAKCQAAGLCGDITQSSTDKEKSFQRFDETQRLVAPPGATQVQFGPEFCCTTQLGGNPGNEDRVILNKTQRHTSSLTDGFLQGHCSSLPNGKCNVDLTLTQNGVTSHPDGNPCTASFCAPAFQCSNVEGTFCETTPVAPPPPCTDEEVCPPVILPEPR